MMVDLYEKYNIPRLSAPEREKALKYWGDKTFEDAVTGLEREGRVMVVRPTGFGKTYLLAKMAAKYIKEQPNKKVLFLYPLNVIKDDILDPKGIYVKEWGLSEDVAHFSWYNTLTNRNNRNENGGIKGIYDEFKNKYSLIILDEAHMAGAEGFKDIYEQVKDVFGKDGTHVIGATATPIRTKNEWDVMTEVFHGSKVFQFTLVDAIRKGIMKPFIHGYPYYGSVKYVQKKVKDANQNTTNKYYNEEHTMAEIAKTLGSVQGVPGYMYEMFKHTGRNFNDSTSCRFINFFRNTADLITRGPDVTNWYDEMFNKHILNEPTYGLSQKFNIRTIYLATNHKAAENSTYGDGQSLIDIAKNSGGKILYVKETKELLGIKQEPFTVDLIFNINMLNMGWHGENITGVAFLRATKSDVLFQQQRGRALSVKDEYPALIYDFVQNANLEARKRGGGRLGKSEIKEMQAMLGVEEFSEEDIEFMNDLSQSRVESTRLVTDLFERVNSPDEERIVWLYQDRQTPIVIIAADLDMTCSEVLAVLKKRKVFVETEEAMFNYAKSKDKTGVIKYLLSKGAKQYATDNLGIDETLLDVYGRVK